MSGVVIRPATPGDAEALRQIYNHAARTSTATMDTEGRTPEQQDAWMESHNGLPYSVLVAERETEKAVVGYAALTSYNPKPGYARTAETSVYLHIDSQGKGIGSLLLSHLLIEAGERGFLCLIALITADNEASLRLHRRCGFTDVGTLRRVGEKFGQELDVVTLQLLLDETIKESEDTMTETDEATSEGEFGAIFAYVRTIPAGRVTSYGEVGAAVGVTARTVGWALTACPQDVPWQRVVGADGYLRIARRSPHLKQLQQQFLESEGVVVNDKGFVEKRFFWDTSEPNEQALDL